MGALQHSKENQLKTEVKCFSALYTALLKHLAHLRQCTLHSRVIQPDLK